MLILFNYFLYQLWQEKYILRAAEKAMKNTGDTMLFLFYWQFFLKEGDTCIRFLLPSNNSLLFQIRISIVRGTLVSLTRDLRLQGFFINQFLRAPEYPIGPIHIFKKTSRRYPHLCVYRRCQRHRQYIRDEMAAIISACLHLKGNINKSLYESKQQQNVNLMSQNCSHLSAASLSPVINLYFLIVFSQNSKWLKQNAQGHGGNRSA